jgi:hypothetical protein
MSFMSETPDETWTDLGDKKTPTMTDNKIPDTTPVQVSVPTETKNEKLPKALNEIYNIIKPFGDERHALRCLVKVFSRLMQIQSEIPTKMLELPLKQAKTIGDCINDVGFDVNFNLGRLDVSIWQCIKQLENK